MAAGYKRLSKSEHSSHGSSSLSYCAVYRPSLTDSKIRCNSWALLRETYQLIPVTLPKKRAWCGNGEELHLEHQIYAKEQGRIRFVTRQQPQGWEIPRLGVQITIQNLDLIDPIEERWKGMVSVVLRVAVKETLGMNLQDKANLRHQWPFGDFADLGELSKDDDQYSFLSRAFGFRFVNLVKEDSGELTGPKTFAELAIDDDYVQGTWTIKGVFSNPVDLSHFPFDACSWDVIVSILGASPGVFYDWSVLSNFREFEVMGMHGISRPTDNRWYPYACEQFVVPNSARGGENFVGCRFYSRRKPEAVLYSIVFPISLATFLGLVPVAQSSGWLRNELAATDPIALQAALLLTIIAIKFSAMQSLPMGLGASTLLDKFFLACVSLNVISLLTVAGMTVQELDSIRAPYMYVILCCLLHTGIGFAAIRYWWISAAPQGEKIYTLPHQEDEPRDTEYLWPGQQDDIHKAHISFVQNLASALSSKEVYAGDNLQADPVALCRLNESAHAHPESHAYALMSERLEHYDGELAS